MRQEVTNSISCKCHPHFLNRQVAIHKADGKKGKIRAVALGGHRVPTRKRVFYDACASGMLAVSVLT